MRPVFQTRKGKCFNASVEEVLSSRSFLKYKGKINLIFTSPPFPLNRKKKYGNKIGQEYISWLTNITKSLNEFLSPDGSFVIEVGNAWEPREPVMSTLPIEALLEVKRTGNYFLCQQFIWFNTAKLPSPAQWVNVDRVRVKDSFTNIWWLSKVPRPKADNKQVLSDYSSSMQKLLKSKKYNAGLRPSEHNIGEESFITDNQGSIPSNILICANTQSNSSYLRYCKDHNIELHPARMPVYIAEFFIKFLTNRGDIVFDPFAGSLTTCESAERLDRKWLAAEPEIKYIEGGKGRFIS
ncbi:MAG: site-specific DNA-methyltransferase [Bacteroidetes bacterium]|nr:MAG: site-specific DNA-methyltransferase [Bacteroidota bacterium]